MANPNPEYLDFDLRLSLLNIATMESRAEVLNSPAGNARADFTFDISTTDLVSFLRELEYYTLQTKLTRKLELEEFSFLKKFGQQLYHNMFINGEVRDTWQDSVGRAEQQEKGLRIRLQLEHPRFNVFPWEYVFQQRRNEFLSTSELTPLVRYLEAPQPIRPLLVNGPLRVLVAISLPKNLPQLNVTRERSLIENALSELVAARRVDLRVLEKCSLENLQDILQTEEFHVLHYIGHGGYEPETAESFICFEDNTNKPTSDLVFGSSLSVLLRSHRSLRLVFLNACEAARPSPTDNFASVAAALIRAGLPAAIAMQFNITDRAAITLSSRFYRSLALGYSVERALGEARKSVYLTVNQVEWGTPVLYSRASDGVLFTPGQVVPFRGNTSPKTPFTPTPDQNRYEAEADATRSYDLLAEYEEARLHQTDPDELNRLLAREQQVREMVNYYKGELARFVPEVADIPTPPANPHAENPDAPEATLPPSLTEIVSRRPRPRTVGRSNRANRDAVSSFQRGKRNYDEGNLERAISDFSEAIRRNPQFVRAYIFRSRAYNALDNFALALADLEKAIQYGGDAAVYFERGLLYQDSNQIDMAIADYSQALQLEVLYADEAEDVYADTLVNRGLAYEEQSRWEDAVADYTAALKHEPDSVRVFAHRAEAFYALQRYPEALADCETFLTRVTNEYPRERAEIEELARSIRQIINKGNI